jgi:hypothetical protein
MKKTLLMLCLLSASAAFGQTAGSVLSAEPQRFDVPSHDATAGPRAMGEEKSLLVSGYNVSGKGSRPLWELAPVKYETPLGDTARMLKKQHESVKKAEIVWEN